MRYARRITICFALGAAVNLIASWTLAVLQWRPTPPHVYYRSERAQDPPLFVSRDVGLTVVCADTPFMTCGSDDEIGVPGYRNPWWEPDDLKTEWFGDDKIALAAGWPFLSLRANATKNQEQWSSEEGWIVAHGEAIGYPMVLPFRPIVHGTVWNTLILGAVATIAHFGSAFGQGVYRARRGLCARCAYPRESHAVCPECGTTHKPRMTDPIAHAPPPA